MIPSVVARQVRETVLDYLRTTFALADSEFEEALFEFLDSEEGLFKGPYLDLRLPFRKAAPGERIPLEIRPDFEPYAHQLKAFQRLYSRDGHQPQHTLVTTGTGSGKTECFLYPILDHCWRNRGKPGVKAILLYPMNALASDQARRIAQLLWDDDRLHGEVTAGLFVGGQGRHGAADREHLVDKRDVLRASPPDILLSNYRMLDFLLMRPEDRNLWQANAPDTLRYLVLDELHTYDGAQGSDVACLVRRLKRRLGCAPGSVCAVGTSATLGSGKLEATTRALTEFATKVFAEEFFDTGVITEDRCGVDEVLGEQRDLDRFPKPSQVAELDPASVAYPDSATWLRRQAELWLGDDAGDLGPLEIGARLDRHDFLRQLLKVLRGRSKSWAELDEGLGPRVPEWDEFGAQARQLLLESFIGLVSSARRLPPDSEDSDRVEPYLTVHAELWLRELRHLVRKVLASGAPPVFAWSDLGISDQHGEEGHWLPIAHCRECGSSGLASFQRVGEPVLRTDLQEIGRLWLNRSRSCRFIAFGHAEDPDGFRTYLCPQCLRVQPGEGAAICDQCRAVTEDSTSDDSVPMIPIRLGGELSDQAPPRFLANCSDCGSDRSLSMLGSRAPSLLSVAISHLYQSDFNSDKKLLAFTDSVQDASHRAGFFGARTYRFTLRTAMQSVIDQSGDSGIPLSELSDRLWEYWSQNFEERGRSPKLIPTLLPADLRELAAYERYLERGGAGNHPHLERDLRERLSWEAVMEYGLNARVGRTLETTLCSTVEVDIGAISEVAEILELELRENSPLDSSIPEDLSQQSLEHFLAGFLNRTRLRGGIDHTLLRSYVREKGNWFFLSKRKQPLMSPFRRESVLPRFVTNRPREVGSDSVFDTFISSPTQWTWYRDWAERSLGIPRKDSGLNEFYREVVRRLETSGLLIRRELSPNGEAWGLNPTRLTATARVGQVVCPECRRRVTLSVGEIERWAGRPCTQYRCLGRFGPGQDATQTYYGRIYRSGVLERIYSQEHTGLLGREQRENLEEAFKQGTDPGAPNLFVCTPTLELGIDIGDLSAAVLCSVPPAPSNYLQRIGRTGRLTGNAFCLTLVNTRPHDLYFHSQPEEMMAGQVQPPGCFLDAPDMLRRQIVAHAMDAWARQGSQVTNIPSQTGFILGEAGQTGFPGRFLQFYQEHRTELTEEFLDCFGEWMGAENRERLAEFANGGQVKELVEGAFDKIRTELKELRNSQDQARTRIREIEDAPESVDDPALEKEDLEETRKLLSRLGVELRHKYPLNVLTDEGVLPNYAFPEPGIRLESVVSQVRDGGRRDYEVKEYIRAASSAIRELAPFNTFYAEGRKVRIDEIDIGSRARPLAETWRLCQECNFMRRELADGELERVCPRCSDLNWTDAGQARTLIHFRRSRSLATRLEASTVDDTEDRESEFYQVLDLIDVAPEHYNGAKLIDEIPFGYELLKELTLREINFGQNPRGQGLRICGQPIGDAGFEVCLDCGRVRDPSGNIRHSAPCRARKSGVQENVSSIFLYREIKSEAIRILLPVSEVGLEHKRASFKAALQLGLKLHFQGDPGHLIVRSVREPIPGGHGVRQYLVVFDGVPGGTGYLSDLWQGTNFLGVLEKALAALQACVCQQDPNRDGCYRCLFAYQTQRELPLISSREAQAILRTILEKSESLRDVRTLSEVKLEAKLESELETKFLLALKGRAEKTRGLSWEERVQGGELRWILGTGERTWEIRAQVGLGRSEGVSTPSRPDFLIRPENADPDVRPIAVFCDGLAFHACPGSDRGRIWDDIHKRTEIIQSGRYRVWSVTWKDVGDFEADRDRMTAKSLFDGINGGQLGRAGTALGLTLDRGTGRMGSMDMLLSYLRQPDVAQWEKLSAAYALAWLSSVRQWLSVEGGRDLKDRLRSEPARFEPGATAQVGANPIVLARKEFHGWFAALARSAAAAFGVGRVEYFLLRIFDEKPARETPDFEGSWRSFLHAWNLLQFQDGLEVVSSELIEERGVLRREDEGAQMVADAPAFGEADELSPDLEKLLEFSTRASRALVRDIAEAGLPLPTVGFELPTEAPGCGPEAELAWPAAQIVVLAERQLEDRPAFESAGWQVLEAPADWDRLRNTLRDWAQRQNEPGGNA